MSRKRGAGGGVGDRELVPGAEQHQLRRPRPAPVGAEGGLAVQHVGEALELRRHRDGHLPAGGQLDVQDQRRRPQPDRRALADQGPDGGVALLPHRQLVRLHHLCARGGLLVLAGEVDPEQHAAELGVAAALLALVCAQRLGVPCPAAGPERQQRPRRQPRPLYRSARAGAVAGAGRALQHVPEVVEPSVGMLGVDIGDVGQAHARLVDEDEGIDPVVGHPAEGQGLEDRDPHHPDPRRVLNSHGVAAGGLDLGGHRHHSFRNRRRPSDLVGRQQ
jgi:hypothetical protein